jgi:hypothetical protein
MRAHLKLSIASVVVLVTASAFAAADDGGWKLPNLNPFTQKGKPPTSSRAASKKNSAWQWPKLWSTQTTTAKTKSKQPSAVQKMTNGTKQLFSKTADALNPWDDAADKQAAPTAPTGLNTRFSQASAKKSTDSPSNTSLIPSWPWGDKAKAKSDSNANDGRPKTVNDFLSQPRVQP